MKIDIDFDEIMRRNLNAAISASVALADKNPEAAGYAEQFERFAKISANITIGILRNPLFSYLLSCLTSLLFSLRTSYSYFRTLSIRFFLFANFFIDFCFVGCYALENRGGDSV